MTDEMETPETFAEYGRGTEPPAQYESFPDFADWLEGQPDLSSLDRYVALLEAEKSGLAQDQVVAAVRAATRLAAVDTGAIEGLYDVDRGFTQTIAFETAAWQVALEAKGETARRAIEDAINGYDYVLDAVTGRVPITEAWIRTLHNVICASQETHRVLTPTGLQEQPLPRGRYKEMPNSPTSVTTGRMHAYASPDDTPAEMHRLVEQLSADDFLAATPVVQAAYAHYAFVAIHPFADGNGRVARALASVFLYRHPGIPLVIFADQRAEYIDALEAADSGDAGPFVAFINQRATDAVEIVRQRLRRGSIPLGSTTLSALDSLLRARGGLTHQEMNAAADRLLQLAIDELTKFPSVTPFPPGVGASLAIYNDMPSPPDGFRNVLPNPRLATLRIHSAAPAEASVERTVVAFIALPQTDSSDLILAAVRDGPGPLDVSAGDVSPTERQALRLRVSSWLEILCDDALVELAEKVRLNLEGLGYR